MKCKECGKPTERGIHHGYFWGAWKKYCSKECRSKNASRVLKKVNKKYNEKFSILRSKRMKKNNPMWQKGVKEKMINTNRILGTKPKVRGGNGQEMPIPQRVLLTALGIGWYAEHIVLTGKKIGLPNCYKIDIAHPKKMIAIEVDGGSHSLLARKTQDKKKTTFLESKGWAVYRFSNKEVMDNLTKVLSSI